MAREFNASLSTFPSLVLIILAGIGVFQVFSWIIPYLK